MPFSKIFQTKKSRFEIILWSKDQFFILDLSNVSSKLSKSDSVKPNTFSGLWNYYVVTFEGPLETGKYRAEDTGECLLAGMVF